MWICVDLGSGFNLHLAATGHIPQRHCQAVKPSLPPPPHHQTEARRIGLTWKSLPGEIIVLDHHGQLVRRESVDAADYAFRCWPHDLDGDGDDEFLQINEGGELQAVRPEDSETIWQWSVPATSSIRNDSIVHNDARSGIGRRAVFDEPRIGENPRSPDLLASDNIPGSADFSRLLKKVGSNREVDNCDNCLGDHLCNHLDAV